MAELETLEEEARDPPAAIARLKSQVRRLQAERDSLSIKLRKHERAAAAGAIQRRVRAWVAARRRRLDTAALSLCHTHKIGRALSSERRSAASGLFMPEEVEERVRQAYAAIPLPRPPLRPPTQDHPSSS